ncbi:MAG: substrate-binding domain-containing protein [Actinomycetota bacterium]|nr:substrate-binding domain-containing protein [Actinomycetota bacterium]
MKIKRRGLSGLAVGMTLALGLTACSSEGGARNEEQAAGGGGGASVGSAGTEQVTIAMITHEAPGDTFWDKIRAGAETAAQALNVDLQYSNNQEAPEQATLVQNAVDQQVDGIAVTLAYANQVGPAAQAAAESGIPVVAFNSGIGVYEDYGISMYFGSDEDLAGQSLGERIAAEPGFQKAVCIIQEQGSVALEARCDGVATGTGGRSEVVNVEGTDLPSVRATLGAKLQQDPSVTHLIALGAPIALEALAAKGEANSEAQVVTFDLNADVAQAIADGEIAFSVDQQPYVQGFMAVQSLWANLTNGNDIGGGLPVLTGPSFVDSKNIEQILPYAGNNTR